MSLFETSRAKRLQLLEDSGLTVKFYPFEYETKAWIGKTEHTGKDTPFDYLKYAVLVVTDYNLKIARDLVCSDGRKFTINGVQEIEGIQHIGVTLLA